MWHELKISKVEKIEKCVAEYQIWMHTVLPYGKLKMVLCQDLVQVKMRNFSPF